MAEALGCTITRPIQQHGATHTCTRTCTRTHTRAHACTCTHGHTAIATATISGSPSDFEVNKDAETKQEERRSCSKSSGIASKRLETALSSRGSRGRYASNKCRTKSDSFVRHATKAQSLDPILFSQKGGATSF